MATSEQLQALINWYQERGIEHPPLAKSIPTADVVAPPKEPTPPSSDDAAQPTKNLIVTEGQGTTAILLVAYASTDLSPQGCLSHEERQLLSQMLKAINVDIAACTLCFFAASDTATSLPQQKKKLETLVDDIQPQFIFSMGRKLNESLFELDNWESKRGQLVPYRGISFIPTWHPNSLLEHPPLKRDSWNDLKRIASHMK